MIIPSTQASPHMPSLMAGFYSSIVGTYFQDVHDFICLLQTSYWVLEELVELSLEPVGINTPWLQLITGTTSTSIRVNL